MEQERKKEKDTHFTEPDFKCVYLISYSLGLSHYLGSIASVTELMIFCQVLGIGIILLAYKVPLN